MRGFFCLIVAAIAAGCTRPWYREQADRESYSLVQQHIPCNAPIGRIDITPDPLSRLADPYNPDRPPKPPDDPTAAFFMDCPGGMYGYSHWDKYGIRDAIEPPDWRASLGLDDRGVLLLTQDRSVEIALANSREFQTALEDVYLQALSLSLNRFEFECQWFGRAGVDYLRTGNSSLPSESNLLTSGYTLGFTRNLAAGGQLLVDFANTFVWEFTGGSYRPIGAFSTQFVQPLIRGFGRNVRLETLTQAERDTLYAVRDFARFRKLFWANVAVFGNGYLDLLLQVQAIRNAQANLKSQEENYRLNIELYRGNKRSVVEVDQAFQGLLSARQQLLDTEIGLQSSLDTFKRRLGLPPTIAVELDDEPLDQFILLDPTVEKLRDDVDAFDLARKAELEEIPDAEALRRNFDELAALGARVVVAVNSAESDLVEWKSLLEAKQFDDEESRLRATETYRQNASVPADVRRAMPELLERIAMHKAAVTPENRQASWFTLNDDIKRVYGLMDEVITAQTLARIYRIELPAYEPNEADAIRQAKEQRLDFQNAQARVTDAWRKMDVAANALRSDLTLTTGATFGTAPDARHPLEFSGDAMVLRAGVQLDGPLNRVLERNLYRISQINYERARRRYMELSDQIEQEIRDSLRGLRQTRVSFEIARQSLIAAARQVENERILLTAPAQQQGANTGDAALRTLRALSDLNVARDRLAATFIRFEQQRIQLLLNLEELQLDERGFPTNADPARDIARFSEAGPAAPPPEAP